MAETCPVCGGRVSPVEVSSVGGAIEFSLCCDVPMSVVDNWALLESLDEPVRELTIQAERDKQEALRTRWDEATEAFREAREEWRERHGKEIGGDGPTFG